MSAERSDFVIDSPLSDDIGTRFAIEHMHSKHTTAVLLLVK